MSNGDQTDVSGSESNLDERSSHHPHLSATPDTASRRSLLRSLAGGLGFLALGGGRAMGKSLLLVPPVQGGGGNPPYTIRSGMTICSFPSYPTTVWTTCPHTSTGPYTFPTNITLSGPTGIAGTRAFTEEHDLARTSTASFTMTWPAAQTVTVYETNSDAYAPTPWWNRTISYEGGNSTNIVAWNADTYSYSLWLTRTMTYTAPYSPGSPESDDAAVAGDLELRSIDGKRGVLDPRTRYGPPFGLVIGD
jgi:hypothetical protein